MLFKSISDAEEYSQSGLQREILVFNRTRGLAEANFDVSGIRR